MKAEKFSKEAMKALVDFYKGIGRELYLPDAQKEWHELTLEEARECFGLASTSLEEAAEDLEGDVHVTVCLVVAGKTLLVWI